MQEPVDMYYALQDARVLSTIHIQQMKGLDSKDRLLSIGRLYV
jgi:hypothetical protein